MNSDHDVRDKIVSCMWFRITSLRQHQSCIWFMYLYFFMQAEKVSTCKQKKFSTKRSMRNNDHQVIRNMQSGKINVEDLEDYYDDHG